MFILRSYFAEKYEKYEINHFGIQSNDLLELEQFLDSLDIVPVNARWYHMVPHKLQK